MTRVIAYNTGLSKVEVQRSANNFLVDKSLVLCVNIYNIIGKSFILKALIPILQLLSISSSTAKD